MSGSSATSSALTLEAVDSDGVIAETVDEDQPGGTRADFLRKAVIGGAASAAALAAPAVAKQGLTKKDIAILRFDLTLEYLQAAMYTEAERLRELRPRTLDWAGVVGANERGHVQAIRGLLGRDAIKSPSIQLPRRNGGRPHLHRDGGGVRGSRRRALEDPGTPARLAAGAGRASCRSTQSRRATRPGFGTSPASYRRPPPSTSGRRRPRWSSWSTPRASLPASAPRTKRRRRPKYTG